MEKYEVINAHYFRKCHRETCVCSTDYLIVENRRAESRGIYQRIVESVVSEEEGGGKISELEKLDKEKGKVGIVNEGFEISYRRNLRNIFGMEYLVKEFGEDDEFLKFV